MYGYYATRRRVRRTQAWTHGQHSSRQQEMTMGQMALTLIVVPLVLLTMVVQWGITAVHRRWGVWGVTACSVLTLVVVMGWAALAQRG